jgi:dTDP-4-amino-4,6-dideoxygalactose transaminase
MGLTSLESVDDFIMINRRNYSEYRSDLREVSGLTLFHYDRPESYNYQYVVLEVDPFQAGLTRDELMAVLMAENILARRYFWPGCHRMEPYSSFQPHAGLLLPETERVTCRLLLLPTGTAIGIDRIATICAIIKTALAHSQAVRRRINLRTKAVQPVRLHPDVESSFSGTAPDASLYEPELIGSAPVK